MKITLVELRKIIRDVVEECYGWPVAEEKYIYDVKPLPSTSFKDPKNAMLKLPKGPNTKTKV